MTHGFAGARPLRPLAVVEPAVRLQSAIEQQRTSFPRLAIVRRKAEVSELEQRVGRRDPLGRVETGVRRPAVAGPPAIPVLLREQERTPSVAGNLLALRDRLWRPERRSDPGASASGLTHRRRAASPSSGRHTRRSSCAESFPAVLALLCRELFHIVAIRTATAPEGLPADCG